MNKAEFVEQIRRHTDGEFLDASEALEVVLRVMVDTWRSGEPVKLQGFGTFHVIVRKAYMTPMGPVPRHSLVQFRASSRLRTLMRGENDC